MKTLILWLCWLHNFIYFLIGQLATKANGGVNPKHDIMKYHDFFVDNVKTSDRVLDIGCGIGLVARDLSKKAAYVTGIDTLPKSIAEAKRRNLDQQNITFILGDATTYAFKEKFDVITLSNVLEHIKNRVDFLKGIRSLAPKFLVRIPMINRDWLTLYKKSIGAEWRLDSTHYTEYTLPSFEGELATAHMKIDSYSIQYGEIWAIVTPDHA